MPNPRSSKRVTASRLLLLAGLGLALGCQSGSTGSLRLAVAFPALRTASMPAATELIPVVVDRHGVTVGSALLSRSHPRAVMPALPIGPLTVYAAAISSDMEVLAIGKAGTEISPGRLATADVELLPVLVFGHDERLSIMSSVRHGFPIEFGLKIKPLPPGDPTKPGPSPSSGPVGGDVQLGALTAQPTTVPVHYPVALSISAGPEDAVLGLWDWHWQVASTDGNLPPGRFSPTRLVGRRAETVWTPQAAGVYELSVEVTDGLRRVTSNTVAVTVQQGTAGGSVGGNF